MQIDKIYVHQQFNTREEVFIFLDQAMVELKTINAQGTYKMALEQRESQSSTGLVDGFAIPHGKSEDIKKATIIYIRNQTGIEWNSLDGSPITDIFALAIPANGDGNHLDSLIAISTQLMDPTVCTKLRQTNNEKEICDIFK